MQIIQQVINIGWKINSNYITSQFMTNMRNLKNTPNFTTKLSQQLTKFKDSSTVSIAHEQIKKIFSQYAYSQIINAFTNKMDSCDRLSQRQKKQYTKIYITLIEFFGAEVLYQQYYERLMQSLYKKQSGVSEVIAYLCKNLLARIYPPQNTVDYVNYILVTFKNHGEIAKIIRNIVEVLDPKLLSPFQAEILAIITQKINSTKSKSQPIEALLSVILAFESQFEHQIAIHNIILKYYKNEDYNVRKRCVDMCYALLVVKQEANPLLHRIVKELRYDKIKHVREAVSNYNALYKQIYGQQQQQRPILKQSSTFSPKNEKIGSSKSFGGNTKHNSITPKTKKKRNQQFFQNAKESDIIKLPDENKDKTQIVDLHDENNNRTQQVQYQQSESYHKISLKKQQPTNSQLINFDSLNPNFENYLKNRQYKQPSISINTDNNEFSKHQQKKQSINISNFGNFSPKNSSKLKQFNIAKPAQQTLSHNLNIQSRISTKFKKQQPPKQLLKQPSYSINNYSKISVENQNENQIDNGRILHALLSFQKTVVDKLDCIQGKIQQIQARLTRIQHNNANISMSENTRGYNFQNLVGNRPNNFKEKIGFNSQIEGLPKIQIFSPPISSEQTPVQRLSQMIKSQTLNYSNLNISEHFSESEYKSSDFMEKFNRFKSLQRWDDAYSLILGHNEYDLLIQLLELQAIPQDNFTLQCLLMEVKKILNNFNALSWLNALLKQRSLSNHLLKRVKQDVIRSNNNQNPHYFQLRKMVLHEIDLQLK